MSSRRDFIRTVVLASGAAYGVSIGACSRAEEQRSVRLHPPRLEAASQRFSVAHAYLRDGSSLPAYSQTIRADVVIVGSGISGLTAAHALRASGFNPLILETEPRAGGAGVSHTIAGAPVPLGSVYFVDRTNEIEKLLSIANIQPQQCPDDVYHIRGATFHNLWSDAELRSASLSAADFEGLRRFRDFVLQLGDDVPSYPIPEVLPAQWKAWDAMSGYAFVSSFASPTLIDILDAYTRSSMGASLRETNAYCLLNFYSSEFGSSFDCPRYTFVGGMSPLTSALREGLDIRMDEIAVRLHPTLRGVEVTSVSADGRVTQIDARAVIVASPKFQLPYLIPTLDATRVNSIRALQYAPYITVHAAASRPILEGGSYDTWHLPATELYTDVICQRELKGFPKDKHIASLYAPQPFNMRMSMQSEEHLASVAGRIVHSFTSYVGGDVADDIEDIYCWAWGHGVVVPTPGSHDGVALINRKDIGKIVLANTDNDASPAIENAVEHGALAAKRALSILSV